MKKRTFRFDPVNSSPVEQQLSSIKSSKESKILRAIDSEAMRARGIIVLVKSN